MLAETQEEKRQAIQEIYQSYLERDIAYLLNIQKTESLTNLVRILAARVYLPIDAFPKFKGIKRLQDGTV